MFRLSSAIAATHSYFQIGYSNLLQSIRPKRVKKKNLEKADEKKEHAQVNGAVRPKGTRVCEGRQRRTSDRVPDFSVLNIPAFF